MTRLTALLLFIACLHVSAHGNAQSITLHEKNVPLRTVLRSITRQSGFHLVFREEWIALSKNVSIDVKGVPLGQALEACFRDQPLTYSIVDETIVVTRKPVQATMTDLETAQPPPFEVRGNVVDSATGAALEGVSIQVRGKSIGTTTDSSGNFTIVISENESLVISRLGYRSVTIKVDPQRSVIKIRLSPLSTVLDEYVAVGYQRERKRDLIGAVAVVNMNEVKDIPVNSPLQAMQGEVAGVHITRDGTPGGTVSQVLVRGTNTLGNNDPLYIVDGQSVENQAIERLNPNDIESFQVLKDAASASIYGSRASNGVIIITTKTARGAGLKVNANTSYTYQHFGPRDHLPMLNTVQRGQVGWQAAINDGTNPNANTQYQYQWHTNPQGIAVLDKVIVDEWLDSTAQGGIRSANTDWYKVISRPGVIINNNISLSNNSPGHGLYLSAGQLYNEGVIKYSDYKQYYVRMNSDFTALKGKLKVGENLQITDGIQRPVGSVSGQSTLNVALLDLPILPVYAQNGTFAGPVGSGFSNRLGALQVADLSKEWKNTDLEVYGNLHLEFTPVKNLTYRSSFGVYYEKNDSIQINPTYTAGFLSNQVNNYSVNNSQHIDMSWYNTLEYRLTAGKHKANLMAGVEASSFDNPTQFASKQGYLIQTANYYQFDAGTGNTTLTGNDQGYQLLSFFSKLNYTFNDRYLFSATLRDDGSSRFGKNNRFGLFPAASAGWRISDEDFVKNKLDFISHFMLRAGVGTTGNQKIANNATYALYLPGYGITAGASGRQNMGSAYDLNGIGSGTLPSGVIQTQTANPNLKWESTTEVNFGTDFGFFNQRLTGSFDYFLRNTSNILIEPPQLAVLGEGGKLWENGASMKNKGWEFVLGYNSRGGALTYRITANIGASRDKITYLPPSVYSAYPGNFEQTILGHSITSNFGYVTQGVFQDQQEVNAAATQPGKAVGRIRYKDLNSDGLIDNRDQTWLGNSLPAFEYGLNASFGYKQFQLSFFIQGVQGLKLYNSVKNLATLYGQFFGENNSTYILNAWTPLHTNTDIPAVSNLDQNNETRQSSYQIENASYLKLKNVQLGYILPQPVQHALRMTSAMIYLSGSQLLTIKSKHFTGPDPENTSYLYPITQSYTIGLHTSF